LIRLPLGGCSVAFLPVVVGLVSEGDRVREAVPGHDAVGISLGGEDILALRHRDRIENDYDISDLEAVYAHHLSRYGAIDLPTPAFVAAVDACDTLGISIAPLDMDDAEFSEMYSETVSLFDVLRGNSLAKKAMKRRFDQPDAESFVMEWDAFVNRVRGNAAVSRERERVIAENIIALAEGKGKVLAIIETERLPGVLSILRGGADE